MRSELSQWLASASEPIRAQFWNDWLETLEALMPEPERRRRAVAEDEFPFQVAVDRWDDPAALPVDRVWRVDVALGFCNDLPASILYLRDDPRGWSVPDDDWLPPGLPVSSAAGAALAYVDRTPLEDDPPFLLVRTPEARATQAAADDDFQPWKGARPSYFQQEEYADKQLWWASVTLSVNPLHAFPNLITGPTRAEIAAKLPEHSRLRAGRPPVTATGGVAGGTIEVARLWLVRDPQAKYILAADTIEVQQRVYSNLQALIITPGLSVSDGTILGELTQDALNAALAAAAGQEFWSG